MIFSANISLLFGELPFVERFEAAAEAGFGAVEWWWPEGEDLDAVRAAAHASGVRTVLLNFYAGTMAAGDRGLAGDRSRERDFLANVPVALALADELGCRRLNALVGLASPGERRERQLERAVANVRWAADQAAAQGAQVLVEPLNRREHAGCLVGRADEALAFIGAVDRPNVRLQYDVYHGHRGEDDVIGTLRRHIGQIAHVQIADSPGRHEPGTGEIDFRHVFGVLDELGYVGHVGLEYRPRGSSEAGLAWLPRDQRSGPVDVERVFASAASR